jgi:hypothetical protein
MSPLEIILASIGGSATLVAVLGWLAKSLVSNLLDKDIASFRYELEKLALEHNVRFSTLHERRDVVIATLYSEIVGFYMASSKGQHSVKRKVDPR